MPKIKATPGKFRTTITNLFEKHGITTENTKYIYYLRLGTNT